MVGNVPAQVPATPHVARVFSAGAAVLVVYWLALAAGVESVLLSHWAYLALLIAPTAAVVARAIAVREDRLAWAALGTGLSLWTFGFVWQVIGHLQGITPPFPNVADAFWLSAYPFIFATFASLARPWLRRAPATLALDTVLVGLGMAAVVTALVLPWVVTNASDISVLAQVVNLAYPLADCALLSVAVIGAAVAGRRGSATWALLALGSVALIVGDGLWTLQAAAGTWEPVMGSNAVYLLWPALAGVAAWLPPGRPRAAASGARLRTHAAALVAALAAIVLLVVNEWAAVPGTSVVLAALALLVAVHRTGLALAGSLRQSKVATRERELVDDVRLALERGDLELHYQPLVDAGSGAVRGAEALLRWPRDGGFVAPDTYLPVVERSNLIAPLTDFVLDRALAAAAGWRRDGYQIGVSVNLATANLTEADLPGRVLHALRRHGVPPAALTLEITETAAIDDNALAEHVLAALESLGVGLAVDDFGTGHSSLVRLARFPICELKIDRSFVREMHTAKRPIVATAIQLAHALGMRVVAEGVEDEATLAALRELECDLAQGYHISRPLPAADFAAWLRTPALV
jgi:EAL domain-containing protein (putative c-di-GMP-specific phosphodiesterase class I)